MRGISLHFVWPWKGAERMDWWWRHFQIVSEESWWGSSFTDKLVPSAVWRDCCHCGVRRAWFLLSEATEHSHRSVVPLWLCREFHFLASDTACSAQTLVLAQTPVFLTNLFVAPWTQLPLVSRSTFLLSPQVLLRRPPPLSLIITVQLAHDSAVSV